MTGKQTAFILICLVVTFIFLSYKYSPLYDKLLLPDFGFPGQSMCGKTIFLPPFPSKNPDRNNQTFFIESSLSGRHLKGRFICAFESALSIGKLPVKLIFRSKSFKVDSPALCSLFDQYYPDKFSVYYTDIDELFHGTPLHGITNRMDWESKIVNVQLSDMMRAAVLYKYGGFYLDNDVLTLTDLRGIRNVVVMDNVMTYPSNTCEAISKEESFLLNQGTIHFEQGNPFILLYMEVANRTYKHGLKWIGLGPPVMHEAASIFLGYQNQPSTPVITPELTIAPSFKFRLYPLRIESSLPRLINLKNDVNGSYFDEYIRCSHTLHLTGAQFKRLPISGNPRRDVLSYLAPKICPKTFAVHLSKF